MGILRNIAKVVVIFLFSLSLTLLLLTFILYNITAYENMKNMFTVVLKDLLLKNITIQEFEEKYSLLSSYCEVNKEAVLPIDNITLKCSEVLERGFGGLVDLIAEKIFDGIYYKTYDCDFPDCFRKMKSNEDLIMIASSSAHSFFDKALKQLLIITVALGVILFFLIETWSGRFKLFGLEFLSIGILFFFLTHLKTFLIQKIPDNLTIVESVLDFVFIKLSQILLIFLVLGIVFVVAWLLSKFFSKPKKSK